MASMTVRGLDEDVKRRFAEKARAAGQSAEAYLRLLIAQAATAPEPERPEPAEDGELSEWIRGILRQARELNLDEVSRREMEEGMRLARYGYGIDS